RKNWTPPRRPFRFALPPLARRGVRGFRQSKAGFAERRNEALAREYGSRAYCIAPIVNVQIISREYNAPVQAPLDTRAASVSAIISRATFAAAIVFAFILSVNLHLAGNDQLTRCGSRCPKIFRSPASACARASGAAPGTAVYRWNVTLVGNARQVDLAL